MSKPITTKLKYEVTLECKLMNKWAKHDGMTAGLKAMNDIFYSMVKGIEDYNKIYKSRKVTIRLIEKEQHGQES